MTTRHPLKTAALTVATGLLAFFCLDALAFRISPYSNYLEPDSSTGLFENVFRTEKLAQTQHGDNLVATFGDSRLAYYPRVSAEVENETGILLRNAGVAGSSARVWYYMLRDLDPTASRYRAIVISANQYDDIDDGFSPADDLRTVHYVAARLRLTDIPQFVASFHDPAARWQAFRDSFFCGLAFQQDALAFLSKPSARVTKVNQTNNGYPHWTYDFVETSRNMAGVQIDWKANKALFPPEMDQNQKDTVNNFTLRQPADQAGVLAAYRREWFGRIIDRYRGSRTKIIFTALPRGPYVRPPEFTPPPAKPYSSVMREFARQPNILIVDERAFQSLEHPELFKDGLHLNDAGCRQFSVLLSREVARLLATAPKSEAGN